MHTYWAPLMAMAFSGLADAQGFQLGPDIPQFSPLPPTTPEPPTTTSSSPQSSDGCALGSCPTCVPFNLGGYIGTDGPAATPVGGPAVTPRAWMMLPGGPLAKRNVEGRPIAGRFIVDDEASKTDLHSLARRALKGANGRRAFKDFGVCVLPSGPPQHTVEENSFPKVSQFPNLQGAASYFMVTRSAPVAGQPCPAPTLYSDADFTGKSVSAGGLLYQTVGAPPPVPGVPPPPRAPFLNSDHVYEISNVLNFFKSQLQDASACTDFTDFFDGPILESIFSYLAGDVFPDLAAMDASVNGVKGDLFNPGPKNRGTWFLPKNKGSFNSREEAVLNNLELAAMAVDAVNMPDFVSLFQKTHQRIYQAFLGVDAAIVAAQATNGAVGQSATWGNAYSTFMSNFLSTQGENASKSAVAGYGIMQKAASSKGADGLLTINALGVASAAASATYPPDKFLFSSAAMLSLAPALTALPVTGSVAAPPVTAAP